MAALAYGAVYGAEPEFFKENPELDLYNAKGAPESIDGIHMDQYGFPKSAFVGSPEGPMIFLDEHFGPLIDDSARAIRAKKPSARVIFNCVNDWPTGKVAACDQAAGYSGRLHDPPSHCRR